MNAITCVGFLFFFTCDAPKPAPPVDTYCDVAKPIRWSAADTRLTKEQVDTHNRKYVALCRTPKK